MMSIQIWSATPVLCEIFFILSLHVWKKRSTTIFVLNTDIFSIVDKQDGRISYEEFATMMKAGTDWRKTSCRERLNCLSVKLREGSLQLANEGR